VPSAPALDIDAAKIRFSATPPSTTPSRASLRRSGPAGPEPRTACASAPVNCAARA